MTFLLATLLALAAGPALYTAARARPAMLAFLDGFVLVSIAGLVVLVAVLVWVAIISLKLQRFERYRDHRDGLYTGLRVNRESESYLFDAAASHIGYRDQRYFANYVGGRVLPITATNLPDEKNSGFEVDFGSIMTIDAIDLMRIPGPFLKRFMLEASGDRSRWTQLVGAGTAFKLPAEGLQHTRIEFRPGDYRYVRLTWDDTNSARVAPPDTVPARKVTPLARGQMLREPVAVSRRPSEPGRSRFRLTLPAPQLPIVALELSVGGGNLMREARIIEARLTGRQAVANSDAVLPSMAAR